MNLPLYTTYALQLLALLGAVLGCLIVLYAILRLAWTLYRTIQGMPLLVNALRHFYATRPEEFKALAALIVHENLPPPPAPPAP